MNRPLFDYEPDGRVLVCTEDNELIVHDGGDESPLWLHRFDAPLVGAAARGDEVIAAASDGALTTFEATSGTVRRNPTFDVEPRGLAVGPTTQDVALLAAEEVLLVQQGVTRSLEVARPTCAAFSPDGQLLAVGDADGLIWLLRLPGGELIRRLRCEAAIEDICPGPGGCWLAAVEDRVLLVEPDVSDGRRMTGLKDSVIRGVAMRTDERLLALRVDEALAIVLAYPSLDTAASIEYVDKQVTTVAFGPHPWFGVGLSQGDGNKINLLTKAVHRTDTHPERQHHSWMLYTGVEPEVTQGAMAAPLPAGRASPQPTTGAPPPPAPHPPGLSKTIIATLAGLVILVVVLVAVLLLR
jgi:WD40 repeat protein